MTDQRPLNSIRDSDPRPVLAHFGLDVALDKGTLECSSCSRIISWQNLGALRVHGSGLFIDKMEREFREPLVQNFHAIVVMAELECQGETVPCCEQLKASGINLPADASVAEALVMDQIAAARQITSQNWTDIAAIVELAEQGPEWWNDSRLPLLALPRVTTCISENRCATFINMELAIDMALGGP